MKYLKRLFMSVVTLVAISVAGVSCLQLEQPVLIENLSGDEIVFGADAYFEAQTKASSGTTETTSLTSFYVSAVTGSAGSESSAWTSTQFSQVAGSSPATYKGSKMWPALDQSYKFYASNVPLTFAAAGTTVSATNTTDVVCAYLTNGTYKTKNTLTFEHIFARFGRVDVAAESGYTISNISIRITPKTGGTYNLRTGAGKTDGTGWSSVTTGSATVVANATGANANDIYLVPGTYQVTATWTATQSGTSITYTNKVVNVPIVGGKTNVVSIVLGGEILFGVDLVEYCDYDYRDNLDYLTFFCDEAGTITWKAMNASNTKTIEYSRDFGASWTSITSTTAGVNISVSAGDMVWFRGNNSAYSAAGNNDNRFSTSGKCYVYGNLGSLLGNEIMGKFAFNGLFRGATKIDMYPAKKLILPSEGLSHRCYTSLFYGCTSLTVAPDLQAMTLAPMCYAQMFQGCTSLETPPELPAMTLAHMCYFSLFRYCSNLKVAPELPATTLANQCYAQMFEGCSSLKVAPELPATTMAGQCYRIMFKQSGIEHAPELPATELADSCYMAMFISCTSLKESPELPAVNLADCCYSGMFQGCSSLKEASVLPATVLTRSCYQQMFASCSSLKTAPDILATTAATKCCAFMFQYCTSLRRVGRYMLNNLVPDCCIQQFDGCTNLVEVPDILPATTLASGCYAFMFRNCVNLEKAPILPALELVDGTESMYTYGCYSGMFQGCSKLNYVKAFFLTTPENGYTENWVNGVAASGTFVKSVAATWNVRGNNGVPSGWIVKAETSGPGQWMDNPDNYLRFKFVTDGQVRWQNKKGDIQYSKNGGAWTAFNGAFVSMSVGDEIWFKGDLTSGIGGSDNSSSSKFYTSGKFYVSGNVQSLCSFNNTLQEYHFGNLFYECVGLNIDDNTPLILPATTLAEGCYNGMFSYCSSLTSAPELPATTLAESCYYSMFSGCSSLTLAPELPVMTLVSGCYENMFSSCTSLTSAPVLPATTLAGYCYNGMFYGCSSLTSAPVLPATTLAEDCYGSMFYGCSSLTSAPVLPATTLAEDCYGEMFSGCTSLISAPVLPATTLEDYCYYRMFYGCSSLTSAPDLPATTLAEFCYYRMFYGCISLTSAPNLLATTLADYCCNGMFQGCSLLTSAPVLPATTLESNCYGYMFSGCTSLTSAPVLPATTLASECYVSMFYGCSSLTSAPDLPATTLAYSCYNGMFSGCSSLTSAPDLPATTLAEYCYCYMFSNCTSLTSAPDLLATTLAVYCCNGMFQGCSSLTTAPELLATTLANSCYRDMFSGCSSLTTAPDLPATTLASECYAYMFSGCTSLNYIKALFDSFPYSMEECTYYWVNGVASSGTFVKSGNATWDVTGVSGVPSGWVVETEMGPIRSIGRFTINSDGDQVAFAPGNLWAHVASGPTNSYNYTADEWGFHVHQWDYCNQSLAVGNTVDHFGWVGRSASFDTYGLCSKVSSEDTYYGTSSSDVLKTDWGDIPGVIASCGDGWFTLSSEQWNYLFNERTTEGDVDGTYDARYTMATIRTDESGGVNGIILFPDGETFWYDEFTTVGTLNAGSAWSTRCTAAEWAALEARGCVFLPASGYRINSGAYDGGTTGRYWSSTRNGTENARRAYFYSGFVDPENSDYRSRGYSVRLVKRL